MTARPNFLFFMTDQHRADHLGCYGNAIVRTPNIDGIAVRGSRFQRFYVSSPVCMPNRATLMTGRMPSAHGVRCNGIPLKLATTTFVDLLAAAGYRTALIGKSHLQNFTGFPPILEREFGREEFSLPPAELDEAVRNPWGEGRYDQENGDQWREDPDHRLDLPFYGYQHVDLVIGHGDRTHGDYGRWLERRHAGSDSLRGPENALPGSDYVVPQGWRTAVPEELYATSWIAERAVAYIEGHDASGDAPFFINCSFPDPHHPFTPPGRYWDMYDPADIPLPDSFFAEGNQSPPSLTYLVNERATGTANILGTDTFIADEREVLEAHALTYGMITMIDDAIGRVLAALDAQGLAEDTVVIFTADHGDFMGDHRLLLKGPLHYQGLIRVPFIWADPDQRPGAGDGGAAHDALSGTLDIAATILERAEVELQNGHQGQSLLGVIEGRENAVYENVLIEDEYQRVFLGFERPPRLRTLVTERYRLTVYDGLGWGEIYDFGEDPKEMYNLWDDPGHSALRGELCEAMARKMTALTDRSPMPTGRA